MRNLIVIALTFSLFSCSGSGKDPKGTTEEEVNEASILPNKTVVMDLMQYGFEVNLPVPDTTNKVVKITPNPNGTINVIVGINYGVTIGYDGDLLMFKEDLKITNDAFDYEIVDEKDDFIVYTTTLKDGSKKFFHFYGVKEVNGAFFEFFDLVGEEHFSEKAIRKMVDFCKSTEPSPSSEGVAS